MDIQTIILTLGGIAWGFVCKYHPKFKTVPNALIPYVTFAVTFLVKLTEAVPADAAGFAIPGVALSTGVFAKVLAAGWQAILNSLIYEVFLKKPAEQILQKP